MDVAPLLLHSGACANVICQAKAPQGSMSITSTQGQKDEWTDGQTDGQNDITDE